MSPRGVYPRKNKTETATTKGGKAMKTKKTESSKKGSITALPTTDVKEQFGILRENISTLSGVRSQLSGEAAITKRVDSEIIEHVSTLSALRKKVFGLTTEEQAAEEHVETKLAAGANGGATVPLPAKPALIPVPTPPTGAAQS